MEDTKIAKTGIKYVDELIECQQRRIETLKSVIDAVEAINAIKEERIQVLKEHIKQLQDER